jgi:uncharacterized membrane protein YdbT with pleckstrin-like domain
MDKPYERLGHKAMLILLLNNSAGAIVIFLAWILLSVASTFINVDQMGYFFLGRNDAGETMGHIITLALFAVFCLVFLALVWAVLVTLIDYYSFRFRVGDHAFRLKRGILNIAETSIPYRQIQDVNLSQGILYQLFGVCRVSILTAGNDEPEEDGEKDHTEGYIPVLPKSRAEQLREELLRRSNVQEVIETQHEPIPAEKNTL